MPRSLRDTVVVVTGASSGIGRATALAFAERGASVVLAARRAEPLERTAADCRAHGVRALAVPTDVTDERAVQDLAAAARALGGLDVWVNNAGVTLYGRTDALPMADFRRVIEVNVLGYVHGARAALSVFREQGRGVLVNVGSVIGMVGQPYSAAYGVSKFAINGLGWTLRQELRADGVRGVSVCTVLPMMTDTPVLRHAGNHTGRGLRALPPLYTPDVVARAVVSAVRRPRREVYAGVAGRFAVAGSRLAPGLVEPAVAYGTRIMHFSRRTDAPDTSGALHEPMAEGVDSDGGMHGVGRTRIRRAAGVGALVAGTAAAVALRRRR